MSRLDYSQWDHLLDEIATDEADSPPVADRIYKIDWDQVVCFTSCLFCLIYFLFHSCKTDYGINIDIELLPGEGHKDNIEVVFKCNYLVVIVKTAPKPVIEGTTFDLIRPHECSWWVDGNMLHLGITKAIERYTWEEVIVSHEIKSNIIDPDKQRTDKEREEAIRKRKDAKAPSKPKPKSSPFPHYSKHKPYNNDQRDMWLFEVDA